MTNEDFADRLLSNLMDCDADSQGMADRRYFIQEALHDAEARGRAAGLERAKEMAIDAIAKIKAVPILTASGEKK